MSIYPARPNTLARDFRLNAADLVAQAYIEHRLRGVFQQIHHLPGRRAKVQLRTIAKQVVFGRGADRCRQICAELA
jgi:hypothetical protein